MTGFGGSTYHHAFARFCILLAGGMLLSAVSYAEEPANLRPGWAKNYFVWSGHANLEIPNYSYLQNRDIDPLGDPLADQIVALIDRQQGLAWRQQYEDMNRDYDQRQRAGLSSPAAEQAHAGAISGFSQDVLKEIEKRKLRETGDVAVHAVQKDEVARTLLAPGAVLAGVWVGRSMNLRLSEDFRFSFRTCLKDRLGQVEFHSPFLQGSFEFHPEAPDNYSLISPTSVDFGRAMDLNHVIDFGAEKYQFRVARALPFIDVSSSVVYASSSNVVAGSLTKQLTSNLAAAVDSVYYLTPYDPEHTSEERVRLRYDVHF